MDKSYIYLTVAYLFLALPQSVMDFRKFRISIPYLIIGSFFILAIRLFLFRFSILLVIENLVFALVTSFLIYFSARVLTAQEFGLGDVFFGISTSIYTGFYLNIVSAVFAALLGVLYYLGLAIIQKSRKKQIVHRPLFAIPFIPFISAGAVLSVFLFSGLF